LAETIIIPRSIIRRILREAERMGMSLEEYVIELLSQSLDPRDKAIEYIEVAKMLLEQARIELEKGDIRQAAEKTWGAAALAVKAYAYMKEGKHIRSHGELWKYTDILKKELGDWVHDAWMSANGMHVCFYEGWCTQDHVKDSLKRIIKLVREIESKIKNKASLSR